jgi:hypothetical protein
MPFQPVTVSYLALGNLVSFLAEDPVGDGSFAFLMQHSEADLLFDGQEANGSNWNVDQTDADVAGPGGMAWDRVKSIILFAGLFCYFRRL